MESVFVFRFLLKRPFPPSHPAPFPLKCPHQPAEKHRHSNCVVLQSKTAVFSNWASQSAGFWADSCAKEQRHPAGQRRGAANPPELF